MNIYTLTLKREFRIALKNPSYVLNPLLFFIIAVSLFPLAISPEAKDLARIAPGVIWVCVMLSVLLSLSTMFYHDYENGMLEQMLTSKHPLLLITISKISMHWLLTGIPMIIASPLLASMFFLDSSSIQMLMITLLLGTPSLSLIGAIGAALTVHLKNSGMLLSLMILPLYVPLLIFAVSAVSYSSDGLEIAGQLYFLAFILVLSLIIAPVLTKFALKIVLE